MDRPLYCLTCFSLWCSWNSGSSDLCHIQSEWPAFETISGAAEPRRCGVFDTPWVESCSVMCWDDSSGVLSTRPGLLRTFFHPISLFFFFSFSLFFPFVQLVLFVFLFYICWLFDFESYLYESCFICFLFQFYFMVLCFFLLPMRTLLRIGVG